MIVLMTTTGMIKNKLFRCQYDISPDLINIFSNLLNEKLKYYDGKNENEFYTITDKKSLLIFVDRGNTNIAADYMDNSKLFKHYDVFYADLCPILNGIKFKGKRLWAVPEDSLVYMEI